MTSPRLFFRIFLHSMVRLFGAAQPHDVVRLLPDLVVVDKLVKYQMTNLAVDSAVLVNDFELTHQSDGY